MIQTGCQSPSELCHLEVAQRKKLAQELYSVPEEPERLQDWNEVLKCLSNEPPKNTVAAAKERIISILTKE